MLFLVSFNKVGSPSITNSDECQICLSFMLAIALHWVTSWSAQIPRLRIFTALAGSRGLRQFANKAGRSTICPLYGWYQTMKFNLTMVTDQELSNLQKKVGSWQHGVTKSMLQLQRYLQMNERRISACRQNDQHWPHKQQTNSSMQISTKFDILPCSLFFITWKH